MQSTLRLIGELGRAANAKDWELLERATRKALWGEMKRNKEERISRRQLKTGKWGWRMEP